MCHINVTHPFRHEVDEVEKLMFLAENAVPHAYSPVVFRGSSSPMTQAGGMAVAGVGELFGLVLSQLVREGCPVAQAGGSAEKLDMRTMVGIYSAPEKQVGFAEMAHFRGVPHFGLGGASDSKLVDQQAVAEASLSLLVEALAGSNLIHDVGYMESGMSNSLAQIVILDEVIGWIRRFIGHGRGQAAGGLLSAERAAIRVEELLEEHQVPALQPAVSEALDDIIKERTKEVTTP